MTKPRGSVIVRRFLAGENFTDLVKLCMRADGSATFLPALRHVEGCIRRALNRKRRSTPRAKQPGRGTRLRFR